MNSRVGLLLPILAGAFALFAIAVGRDDPLAALVVGALAVLLAGLACARVAGWRPFGSREATLPADISPAAIRALFRRGRYGREELLVRLDELDRAHRLLPARRRTPAEKEALLRASAEQFDAYLARRLERLDGST